MEHLGYSPCKSMMGLEDELPFPFRVGQPCQGRFDSVKLLGYVLFDVYLLPSVFLFECASFERPKKTLYSFMFIQLSVYYNYVHVFLFFFFPLLLGRGHAQCTVFWFKNWGSKWHLQTCVSCALETYILREFNSEFVLENSLGLKRKGSSSSHQFSRGTMNLQWCVFKNPRNHPRHILRWLGCRSSPLQHWKFSFHESILKKKTPRRLDFGLFWRSPTKKAWIVNRIPRILAYVCLCYLII